MGDSDIEIKITADGQEAINQLKATGDAAKGMGDSAGEGLGRGSLAAMGFKASAHELAAELGVHGPMLRGLGEQAVGLAESFGTNAVALGVVGVAALATYKIYEHFAEATQKKREELDKSVKSLEGEVSALYKNEAANKAVEKAQYRVLEAKRAELLLNMKNKIQEDTQALKEQGRELDIAAGKIHTFGQVVSGAYRLMFKETADEYRKNNADHAQQLGLRLNTTKEKLKEELEEYKKFSKDVSYESFSGEQKAQAARMLAALVGQRAYTDLWFKAAAESEKLQAQHEANIKKIMEQAERDQEDITLKGFDLQFTRMVQAHQKEQAELVKNGATKAQLSKLSGLQEMAEQDLVLKHQQDTDKLKFQSTETTLGNTAQAMQSFYQTSNKHSRAMFELYQASAIGQAIMHTYSAANNALDDMPYPYNIAAAASVILLGMANVASIASQSFGSTSASSSAAVGTYPASPATGLPTSAPASSTQQSGGDTYIIMQDNRGQETGRYKYDTTKMVLETLMENYGTVGGLSVQVQKHA